METADEFDPLYCLRCRAPLPHTVGERQTLCEQCLAEERSRGAEFAAEHPDTRVATCPKCGGRNVTVTMYAAPWKAVLVGVFRLWMWLDTITPFGSTGVSIGDGETDGDIRLKCRDCGKVF